MMKKMKKRKQKKPKNFFGLVIQHTAVIFFEKNGGIFRGDV